MFLYVIALRQRTPSIWTSFLLSVDWERESRFEDLDLLFSIHQRNDPIRQDAADSTVEDLSGSITVLRNSNILSCLFRFPSISIHCRIRHSNVNVNELRNVSFAPIVLWLSPFKIHTLDNDYSSNICLGPSIHLESWSGCYSLSPSPCNKRVCISLTLFSACWFVLITPLACE